MYRGKLGVNEMQSIPVNFWQWLSSLNSHDQLGALSVVVVFAAAALVASIGIICITVAA